MSRDRAFEDRFLADVEHVATIGGGHQAAHFTRLVRERLALGDRLYGDRYLTRDGMGEALEEPCDAIAWALLELQRRRAIGTPPEQLEAARAEIVGAAAQLAAGDASLRRAQRILDGDD